jgi:hypothetical protein
MAKMVSELAAFENHVGMQAGPLHRPPGVFSRKQWPASSMASRILNEVIEHEAWFIELLAHKRDGKSIPAGHLRRGEPGHAPYSKNAGFYNP